MGATNVMQAYRLYAGRVPPTSMQLLAYMALVSRDEDRRPWYGQGHEALAQLALGRPTPIGVADVRAVERAMTPLFQAGAVTTDRPAAVRRDAPNTARYRLHLDEPSPTRQADPTRRSRPTKSVGREGGRPTETVGREPVDNPSQDPPRPTKSGVHAPRNSDSRPTNSGLTPHEFRGTEEPRGTTRSEKTEEEEVDLRTNLTMVSYPQAAQDPIPPPRCPDPRCANGWLLDNGQLRHCPACARDPTDTPSTVDRPPDRGAAA